MLRPAALPALVRTAADEMHLHVRDDGRGMDAAAATPGFGLPGAGERAVAVGVTLACCAARRVPQ